MSGPLLNTVAQNEQNHQRSMYFSQCKSASTYTHGHTQYKSTPTPSVSMLCIIKKCFSCDGAAQSGRIELQGLREAGDGAPWPTAWWARAWARTYLQSNRSTGTPARKKRPFYSTMLHVFWYAFNLWITLCNTKRKILCSWKATEFFWVHWLLSCPKWALVLIWKCFSGFQRRFAIFSPGIRFLAHRVRCNWAIDSR